MNRTCEAGATHSAQEDTASSWIDTCARWSIRHAARRAPPPLSERLEEEWLADLEARTTPGSRLLLGLGCYWAAAVIVQEHLAPGLTAAATTGNKVMSSCVRADISILPQRTTALAVIIGLHVALILAFASGLAHKPGAVLPQAIQTSFLNEKPKDPLIPPPTSDIKLTKPTVVVPENPVRFDFPPDGESIHAPPAVEHTELPPPQPPPRLVNRVQGGPGKGFPNSADYYPPASIRSGETGTTVITVCVDSTGHLSANPTVARSSGSTRLDEGALKLTRAASGHYRATTENGQPVDSCYPLGITFKLRD